MRTEWRGAATSGCAVIAQEAEHSQLVSTHVSIHNVSPSLSVSGGSVLQQPAASEAEPQQHQDRLQHQLQAAQRSRRQGPGQDSPGIFNSAFYSTRVQVVSEREEEELLSLSPQPSIISTVTHGATKKNLIHPSKERDYGGAKYGGGASTERAEVTTDTFTQPYPLAHHLVVHITLFQFSCPPFLQFSGSFYIISDFGDFNMQCTI